jgi:hypothetical protein
LGEFVAHFVGCFREMIEFTMIEFTEEASIHYASSVKKPL